MRTIRTWWAGALLALLLPACEPAEQFDDTVYGNFDALWSILDSRYCFFSYKDVDWDKVYTDYRARLAPDMGEQAFFDVCAEMLGELRDGHVNLASSFDVARYWEWFEAYPENFDRELVMKNYLHQPDYRIAAGLSYRILDDCNIGYVYYENFSTPVGESNLDQVLLAFAACDGIIIDVRNNGGGVLSNVHRIAARFTAADFVSGYIRHKTGPAHDDFSDYYPVVQHTASVYRMHFAKPVAVLTNRRCYSATNDFVAVMSCLPQVAVVGDRTGGGSGLPFSSELPLGWIVRFSASPTYSADYEQIEFGIDPDIPAALAPDNAAAGIDSIIERAKRWILSGE